MANFYSSLLRPIFGRFTFTHTQTTNCTRAFLIKGWGGVHEQNTNSNGLRSTVGVGVARGVAHGRRLAAAAALASPPASCRRKRLLPEEEDDEHSERFLGCRKSVSMKRKQTKQMKISTPFSQLQSLAIEILFPGRATRNDKSQPEREHQRKKERGQETRERGRRRKVGGGGGGGGDEAPRVEGEDKGREEEPPGG